jgi:hypothetical protein
MTLDLSLKPGEQQVGDFMCRPWFSELLVPSGWTLDPSKHIIYKIAMLEDLGRKWRHMRVVAYSKPTQWVTGPTHSGPWTPVQPGRHSA